MNYYTEYSDKNSYGRKTFPYIRGHDTTIPLEFNQLIYSPWHHKF